MHIQRKSIFSVKKLGFKKTFYQNIKKITSNNSDNRSDLKYSFINQFMN